MRMQKGKKNMKKMKVGNSGPFLDESCVQI